MITHFIITPPTPAVGRWECKYMRHPFHPNFSRPLAHDTHALRRSTDGQRCKLDLWNGRCRHISSCLLQRYKIFWIIKRKWQENFKEALFINKEGLFIWLRGRTYQQKGCKWWHPQNMIPRRQMKRILTNAVGESGRFPDGNCCNPPHITTYSAEEYGTVWAERGRCLNHLTCPFAAFHGAVRAISQGRSGHFAGWQGTFQVEKR